MTGEGDSKGEMCDLRLEWLWRSPFCEELGKEAEEIARAKT